ncbi:hypothetical protein F0919_14310 [Taibaiella lutea]|uniref:Uncharacterized protein n=1 Tax=Taibaiella lutea TaxID=2608001 RepID=A0A5M6CIC3_9BACT|nr:DUF6365 family protein [Taibaiella lutea]KAA5533702.1 hypothetical protein F0919_14310 [Taibaiella lutea]
MKERILFVVTSKNNMGDLALCLNWIKDLGREEYHFGFVFDAEFTKYISEEDSYYIFEKSKNVKQTILDAVVQFSADAIIFGTNSFWNLPGYTGCKFGQFILDEDDVTIPVMSFDPFESGFTHIMPQTGSIISFSAVPDWVYALRYMSIEQLSANARHFYSESIYNKSTLMDPAQTMLKWKSKPGAKTIFYPLSKDRFNSIEVLYPDYFKYLATIFNELAADNVQIVTILPRKIQEWQSLSNVTILPAMSYSEFLSMISYSDLYLTDSYISCIVDAIQLETPALLLMNSEETLPSSEISFLKGKVFPFWVWPYGMRRVCMQLERLFELKECYEKVEILNRNAVLHSIRDLLFNEQKQSELIGSCSKWKNKRKEMLPAPKSVIKNIMDNHFRFVSDKKTLKNNY